MRHWLNTEWKVFWVGVGPAVAMILGAIGYNLYKIVVSAL